MSLRKVNIVKCKHLSIQAVITMEELKEFLESSTIHGLALISTTKSLLSKVFWLVVVVFSIVTATIIIVSLFISWDASPVSTTIETKPIRKLEFPLVTICPPAGSTTAINSDLKQAENINLTKSFRGELSRMSAEIIEDEAFKELQDEEEGFVEEDKYMNWYRGYSKPTLPFEEQNYGHSYTQTYIQAYQFETSALQGSVSSPGYGKPFKLEKFKKLVRYEYTIHLPENTNMAYNGSRLVLRLRLEIVGRILGDQSEKVYIDAPGSYKTEWLVSTENLTRVFVVDEEFVGKRKNLVIKYIRRLETTSHLNLVRMTGISFDWYLTDEPFVEKGKKSTPKFLSEDRNLHFIKLVNFIYSRVLQQNDSMERLWLDVRAFRLDWLDQRRLSAASHCHAERMITDDTVTQFITRNQEDQKLKREVAKHPVHWNESIDWLLRPVAKMFFYLTNCPSIREG